MSSFDEAIDNVIEQEVDTLLRGSHDDQVRFIEKNFNIKIRDEYDEWSNFIEIFERRNLAAHGKCIINKYYIENCMRHGLNVKAGQKGEELPINAKYLRRSADRLMEFGLVLMFVLWRKHFPDRSEDAYKQLNDLTYDLIKDDSPRISARILEFALYKQKPVVEDRLKKMMTINLANALKKSKNESRANEIIQSVDWSASADEFKICVAALQGNVDRFVELMPRVAQSETVTKTYFREWPVFDWVRSEEAVRQKFYEIFGESLIQPAEQEVDKAEAAGEPETTNDTVEAKTVH